MPESTIRAVGYRRVSMREQLEGHSLEAQANHITVYAASHGWTLVDIYTDAGISAKRGSARPALECLLADAGRGRFDVIVVDKIDRFYRHLGGLSVTLDRLHEANVAFASVQDRLDFTSPWSKLTLTVLGMLAEIYIDNLRQEIHKGKLQRAREGHWNGNIPLGYCRGQCANCNDVNGPGYCPPVGQPNQTTDPKALVLHPIDQQAVRLAFEWYLTGQYTHGQIAAQLNGYVCRLPDGTENHSRTKGILGFTSPSQFNRYTVRASLERRFYTGAVVYRGVGRSRRLGEPVETFQGQHPPIITPDMFSAAQKLKAAYAHSPRYQHRQPAKIYPLSGLLRCSRCGAKMEVILNQ